MRSITEALTELVETVRLTGKVPAHVLALAMSACIISAVGSAILVAYGSLFSAVLGAGFLVLSLRGVFMAASLYRYVDR